MAHKHIELSKDQYTLAKSSPWRRLPMIGLVLAIAGYALAVATTDAADLASIRKFWTSYVNSWMFVLALGLGGLWFVIVQWLVRAGWSIVVRRIAENVAITVPFVALLGIPILFGGGGHEGEGHEEDASAHHEKKNPAPGVDSFCIPEDVSKERLELFEADLREEHKLGEEEKFPYTEPVPCANPALYCNEVTLSCQEPVRFLGQPCGAKDAPACAHGLVCEGEGEKTCQEHVPGFLPGSHHIFEWTHKDVVAADPMLTAKASYLNETAARLRYAIYLVIWSFIAITFYRLSTRSDTAGKKEVIENAHKQRFWSAISLLAFAMTATFGAFDWLMSLDPHWFSTIFGVYFFAGAALSLNSLLVIIIWLLQRSGYLRGVVTSEHYHDLGKFMFGFTVFWTYIAFSQYFLIWYANIPEETHWFAYRGHGDWLVLSLVVVFGRFVLPFFGLLRRGHKRNANILILFAVFIVAMEFVDMFWLTQPAYAHHLAEHYKGLNDFEMWHYYENYVSITMQDLGAFLGASGVFLAVFGWALRRNALVPIKDPRLQESLNHENF